MYLPPPPSLPRVEFCFELSSTFTFQPLRFVSTCLATAILSTRERIFGEKKLHGSVSPAAVFLVVRVINKYFLCPVPTYVPIQFSLQVFSFLGWGICSEQHYDEQGPLRLHQSNSYKRLVCPSVRPSVSL